MSLTPWNRLLPPNLTLGGSTRFAEPLLDPTQTWKITGGENPSTALVANSHSENSPEKLSLSVEFSDTRLKTPPMAPIPLPLIIAHMDWDWIEFHYQPLPELEVETIIWVPDPRILCGRHTIHQNRHQNREINIKLTCQGKKGEEGFRFSSDSYQGRNILTGRSAQQNVCLFLTGVEIYPGKPSNQLNSTVALKPKGKTELRWVLVCCHSDADPRTYLEEVLKLDWDGEISHRKITLSSQLQIKTGNADQDFALAFSQRQARLILNQLILQSKYGGPDEPFLTPLQIWQLILALEPLDPSTMAWLLRKAFNGKQGKKPQFPLQTELLLRARQAGIDQDSLGGFLPGIIENLQSWFSSINDRDGDGIPEEPGRDYFQLGGYHLMEGNNCIEPCLDDDHLETPGIAALLHNEISHLMGMREAYPVPSIPPELIGRIHALEEYILSSWQDAESRFQTRDYQSHSSGAGYTLPGKIRNGWNILRTELPRPSRLRLDFPRMTKDHLSGILLVTLQGADWLGRYRIEEFSTSDILWHDKGGWGTSNSIFSRLDHCNVRGLDGNQGIQIMAPPSDRQDLSLILPLWFDGLPEAFKEKMISITLAKPGSFKSDFGLRSYPLRAGSIVQLPLNLLANQGLVRVGHSKQAGVIFNSWLNTAAQNIHREGSLYACWDSDTGAGLGKTNQLESTLPVGMYLDLLAVRFQMNGDLILEERSPVLFPHKLIYRGTEITLGEKQTVLRRPGGDSTVLTRGKETVIHF